MKGKLFMLFLAFKKINCLISKVVFAMFCILFLSTNAIFLYSHEHDFLDQQEANYHKCFTSIRNNPVKYSEFLNNKKEKNNKVQNDTIDFTSGRVKTQKVHISSNGNFAIHYDTSGFMRVDKSDKNKNNVPDYVDSVAYYMEYVYHIEVEQFGYQSPLNDFNADSTVQYDIYIRELGHLGYYGWTETEQNLPSKGFLRSTTFMVIDNNYIETDQHPNNSGVWVKSYNTSGIEGLKVTLAHEFHHAIQYYYGASNALYQEMSSVYMEMLVFPEIKDYLQYVRAILNPKVGRPSYWSLASRSPEQGYSYGIFAQMLNLEYGDTVIKRSWEMIQDSVNEFQALDLILKSKNSSFQNEWNRFQKYIYYTGKRSIDGMYFPDAKLMPEVKFDSAFSIQNTNYISSQRFGNLLSYSFSTIRAISPGESSITDDTLDFVISNPNFEQLINPIDDQAQEFDLKFLKYDSTNFSQIENRNIFYKINQNIPNHQVFVHYGNETVALEYASPNPYKQDQENVLFLPIDESLPLYDYVNFYIYSEDLTLLYKNQTKNEGQILAKTNKRVVPFDIKRNIPNLSSGIYFFETESNGKKIYGKFAVIQ